MDHILLKMRKLGLYGIEIDPSYGTVRSDDKLSFALQVKQSVNYQRAIYKLYGDNMDMMLDEVIERAEKFKEITVKGFNYNEEKLNES